MSTANSLTGFTKSQMEITPKEMSIVRSAIKILKEEEEKEEEEEKDHLTIGLLNKYIEFVKAFNGGNSGYQFIKNVDEFHSYDCQDNEYCKELKTHIINNSALSRNRSKQAAAAPHYNIQRMNLNPQTYSSGLGVGGGKRKVSKKSRKSRAKKFNKSKRSKKSRRH
jgi:hypothetical protein